jgi:hypothetical protein
MVPVYKTTLSHIPEGVVIEMPSNRGKNVDLMMFRRWKSWGGCVREN